VHVNWHYSIIILYVLISLLLYLFDGNKRQVEARKSRWSCHGEPTNTRVAARKYAPKAKTNDRNSELINNCQVPTQRR